ncbi:hypothetical protein GPECTOR_49g474 [Gonium pectorale]|uniref:Potassium channel tetramerisation-type BTB domain-containing protein n=1 Tax=Gonium pectorale TaxID=33097 RepID=A0A150G953_GONPE|nr:hypothetical protein GPECTOR_49g474 [Gonium pectorale]|eukprot:KXZ45890.1 hypothetical protein GPECTOR_49g474 [Gonium pectorale]
MRTLTAQEEELRAAAAKMSAASRRMEAASSRRPPSDIIPLNVGGSLMTTSRRTLTLVPDSLLETMFNGSWDDQLQRDDSGRVFLDYDPIHFAALLNWLRAQDLGGPEGPLGEVTVGPGQEEQLLVLIDFLQLQRHVPCRYSETFCPALSSPFLSLSGSTAWRTPGGGPGSYAMATAAHTLFDLDVEVLFEVLRFGAVTGGEDNGGDDEGDSEVPNHPMFIGIMAQDQLLATDLQSSSHGWWTSRRRGAEALWADGDSLYLSVDAAKYPHRAAGAETRHRNHPASPSSVVAAAGAGDGAAAPGGGGGPRLSLTNTRTGERLYLEAAADCLEGCEEQWVIVVGLAGRGDEVRINSARRKGAKPQHDAHAAAAAAGQQPGSDGAAAATANVTIGPAAAAAARGQGAVNGGDERGQAAGGVGGAAGGGAAGANGHGRRRRGRGGAAGGQQ